MQTDDLKPVFVNPIMACPRELLANRGCPFFKRRSLFTPYADELRRTDGLAARELCDYVTAYTDFPLELLLVSLLKTQPLSALAQNLHWCYPVGAPTGETPDLNELGLRLLHYEQPAADPVTEWYNRQVAANADTLLAEAAALFEKKPMLGVLSPSLPLWQGCTAARRAVWMREKDALAQEVSVPVGSDPPPAPNCGWVLVRESAFPDGIPACTSQRDAWKLALTAQKNGAYAAAFEPLTRSAARADILNEYETAAAQPAAVAKQLGRLVKHRLQK